MTRRRILITEDDMSLLKDLVSGGRAALRRDQGHLEELDRELGRAELVAAGDIPPDVVTMHSTVTVRDLDTDESVIYTIVFPVEADIATKRISVLAPVGTALIGYRTGDVIEWATPGGTRRLRIEAVLFQPEAASRQRLSAEAAVDVTPAGSQSERRSGRRGSSRTVPPAGPIGYTGAYRELSGAGIESGPVVASQPSGGPW